MSRPLTAEQIKDVKPPEGEQTFTNFALQEIAAQLAEHNALLEMVLIALQRVSRG